MEVTREAGGFEIMQKRIKKDELRDTYEGAVLYKDTHEEIFGKIERALGGLMPEKLVRGKPAMDIGIYVKDGKRELLGVVISEEGDYKGKREHLGDFKHRAMDIHVSENDLNATHLRVTYASPTGKIRKELIAILNDEFDERIKE
jgi:hypothetical protein